MVKQVPAQMGVLRQSCVECRACPLRQSAFVEVTPVFGRLAHPGSEVEPEKIRIVIVGEAPGPTENKTGRPFVGPSGDILARLMMIAGIDPKTVWITNAVACWPHDEGRGGRPITIEPPRHSIQVCSGLHLDAQLAVFGNAKVIVALGSTAIAATMGRTEDGKFNPPNRVAPFLAYRPGEVLLASDRPRTFPWRGRTVLATYHPAYLARRGYQPEDDPALHVDATTVLRTLVYANRLAEVPSPDRE